MSKYKVTQEFIDALNKWKYEQDLDIMVNVSPEDLIRLPEIVKSWQNYPIKLVDRNNRLIAVINWINGKEVFEVGTPKYVVQRKDAVLSGVHQYLNLERNGNVHLTYGLENATRFDDFEKASEWYNKHFEVVEVDEKEL